MFHHHPFVFLTTPHILLDCRASTYHSLQGLHILHTDIQGNSPQCFRKTNKVSLLFSYPFP